MDALLLSKRIPPGPARRLFQALAGESLNGPFHDGRRRFSAISRDGVPFQWSVAIGQRPGGLRFITDCGVPGSSISERIRYTRAMLASVAPSLPLSGDALCGLDLALQCLLPRPGLLDHSLMGLCIAAQLSPDGSVDLKVYVNGEVGTISERYRRFAECLTAFNRRSALQQLRDLSAAVGDRMTPAFVAFDLGARGIGRLKLYFRPGDGTPALQAMAAEAAGCSRAATVLEALHRAFLTAPAYPAAAVDVSVEFPKEDQEPGFKVDLRTIDFLVSDADADLRIRNLIVMLGYSDEDYRIVRDLVVGVPVPDRIRQIVFAGLASRQNECRLDVYFHPSPRDVAC